MLHVEDQEHEDLIPILIFRRHLSFNSDWNEAEIEEKMQQRIVGQNMKVQYNGKESDSNIAVKIEILEEKKNG